MAALDLFNPSGAKKEEKQNTEVYRVSFKDGKNGVYRSVIRFIPNFADPSKSTMIKSVSWVKNPITQKGMYVDDPRSVGQPSPVTDMYFNLYNTGIATYVDWAKAHLGSKKQYASLVQIMADEQHPELVGQIRVFVYGKKVYEKLNNEEYPPSGQEGINPFHPIYGRKFSLICTNQSGFNNFDQSSFYDERNGNQILPSGMWYVDPANPNQFSVVDENTNPDVLMQYLSQNSPDLSKFDYHDWTDEQTKHVEEVLAIARNFMNNGTMMGTQGQTMQAGMQAVNTPNPQIPGVAPAAPAFNPAPQFPGATVAPAPTAAPAPQAGGFVPNTPSAPTIPGAVPPTTAAPAPASPAATPVIPGGVSGVVPPVVTPKAAPAPENGAAPAGAAPAGMNVDDILNPL